MSTTKAYLAGLGTTGVLIGSILVLLMLGSGFVAFDGLPGFGSTKDPVERVVVDEEALDAGKKKRSHRLSEAGGPSRLGAAEPYSPTPFSLAAQASQGAAPGRGDARRRTPGKRAPQGHGGAQVPVAGVLGGGASVGDAGDEEDRSLARRGGRRSEPLSLPRQGGRASGGQPAPRRRGTSSEGARGSGRDRPREGGGPAGGSRVPHSASGLLRAIPETGGGVIWEDSGRGNGPRVVTPDLRRPSSPPHRG